MTDLLTVITLAGRILRFLQLGAYFDADSLASALTASREDVSACLAWLATLGIAKDHGRGSYALAPRLGGPEGAYNPWKKGDRYIWSKPS